MHRIVLALGVALIPGIAVAHPDHGLTSTDVGILHFVTDPFHLALTGAAALVIVGLRYLLRTRRAVARDRA